MICFGNMSKLDSIRGGVRIKLDLTEIAVSGNSTITKEDKEEARRIYEGLHTGVINYETAQRFIDRIRYG